MEFEPKTIPEGINTSEEHPLREFFLLAGGISLVVVAVIYLLAISSDYLIQYIPIEKENEWFSSEMFMESDDESIPEPDKIKHNAEKYLLSLVDHLQDDKYKNYKFTINIIEDETPNAFIVPGGHIIVTYGLLKTITSENALAMVIGHEMGHQYHRHPLKSAGRGIVIALGLMILTGFDDSDLMQGFIGNTVSMTGLAFSRDQEREADATGVNLLVKKYRHASGASEFFKNLQEDPEYESKLPVFLSTHPGTEERIKFLQEFERENSGRLSPMHRDVIEYVNQVNRKKEKNHEVD